MSATSEQKNIKKLPSLSSTLTRAFMSLGFFGLLISGALVLYFNVQSLRKEVAGAQQLLAQNIALNIEDAIEERVSILENVVGVNNLIELNQLDQQLVLEKLIGLERAYRQIKIINKDGNPVADAMRFTDLSPFNMSSEERLDMLTKSSEGKEYVGKIYFDESSAEPLLLIAVPIRNKFGAQNGTILAEMNLKFIWNLIESIERTDGGTQYVVDKNGTLIAFHDIARVLRKENVSNIPEVKEFININGLPVDEAPARSSIGITGTKVVATYAHLKHLDWGVVVESPMLASYADVPNMLKVSFMVLIFTLCLTALIGLYRARKIIAPILYLRDVAESIAHGDYSLRAVGGTYQEVRSLTVSFNQMLNKVQSYKGELEKKINLLSEEHSRFISAVDSVPTGIIALDKNGNVTAINTAFLNILKLSKSITTIKELNEQFSPTIILSHYYERVLRDGVSLMLSDILLDVMHLKIFFAPIFSDAKNDKPQVIGIVILVENITEQIIIERSKDEFFAIISHELRTPLTSIRGNASLLRDHYSGKLNDPEVDEIVEEINISSERLITIVGDFLELSRLEQHRVVFIREQFSLSILVGLVVDTLKAKAALKNLSLEFPDDANDEAFEVYADLEQVKGVLVNLIQNAIEYTEMGTVAVSLAFEGGQVIVSVVDSGVGIPTERQPFLFRKLQQASVDVLARKVNQGIGLRLYMSRLIIEEMGGKIWLKESVQGKGSTFCFSLPRPRPH